MMAMSGIRAHNQELMDFGLTLPGFVERSQVIASLPSLSLLTLASYVPPGIGIQYVEVPDAAKIPALPIDFDLVLITSLSAQIREAYQVAGHYKKLGIPVVMGGLHVSSLPEEALRHCDAVVAGEGEILWPRLLDDFLAGKMQRLYQAAPGESFDLADSRIPRFDLLDISKYNRLTVQTSRGCPHRCDFCASSILISPRYKVKPVNKVIAEIRAIKKIWAKPFIEFADDNSFVIKGHYRDLLKELKKENVKWFTETDIAVAEDDELLELMRESGCKQVLIGLESASPGGLEGLEMNRNWKRGRFQGYAEAVKKIQSHGVTVNGCFVLGLDGDDEGCFERVREFVEESGLYEVQITVMTAFPGTPLYARLKREGRLIEDEAWHTCTLFDVNYTPRNMSVQRLERGLRELALKLYDKDFIQRRQKAFFAARRGHGRGAAASEGASQ